MSIGFRVSGSEVYRSYSEVQYYEVEKSIAKFIVFRLEFLLG